MKKIFFWAILTILCLNNTYGVSVNAAFTKVAIDENKYFIDFINPHLTNFQTRDYFDRYKEAVTLDFEANTLYLGGDFSKCVEKILESQAILRKLYYDILTTRYEVDAEQMLKMSGPIILLSKDKKAEYFLRSGYEEKTKGIYQRKIGFSTHKKMLSQKIKYYIDAIDHLIRAKRYAILALIESTIPLIDKTDYKPQTFAEALAKKNQVKQFREINDYEFIRNELINNINKKSLPTDFPFLLHHNDNYSMIHEGKKSLLNEIGDSINATVKGFKIDQKTPAGNSDNNANPNPNGDNNTDTNTDTNDKAGK